MQAMLGLHGVQGLAPARGRRRDACSGKKRNGSLKRAGRAKYHAPLLAAVLIKQNAVNQTQKKQPENGLLNPVFSLKPLQNPQKPRKFPTSQTHPRPTPP